MVQDSFSEGPVYVSRALAALGAFLALAVLVSLL